MGVPTLPTVGTTAVCMRMKVALAAVTWFGSLSAGFAVMVMV